MPSQWHPFYFRWIFSEFDSKISLTSPSVETGDRKMFSNMMFFSQEKVLQNDKNKPICGIEVAPFRSWSPA